MGKLSPSKEDYLRVLLNGCNGGNAMQSKNIAVTIGVSRASVSRMMAVLKQSGYINMEKFGAITLTKKGKDYAQQIEKRHSVLKLFLTSVLKIDGGKADKEACKMEHAVSTPTAQRLEKLIDILADCVKNYDFNIKTM